MSGGAQLAQRSLNGEVHSGDSHRLFRKFDKAVRQQRRRGSAFGPFGKERDGVNLRVEPHANAVFLRPYNPANELADMADHD